MLPTIPLKKSQHTHTSSHHTTTHGKSLVAHKNRKGVFSSPWLALLIVLVMLFLGVAIIRYSRAAGSVGGVPQNLVDIQNYVNSLQISSTNAKDVNGYGQFSYNPKTDQAVKTVGYYVDGNLIQTVTKPPYTVTINTYYFNNGQRSLTAVAFDNNDLPVAAKTQVIHVQNDNSILQSATNIVTYPWHWLLNL